MTTIKQAAALWWRLLLSELETSAVMRTPGTAGRHAALRVNAVRELFFRLIGEASIDCLIEIGAKDAETSRRFVQSKPGSRATAYEAAPPTYEATLASGLPDRMELVDCAIGARSGEVRFFMAVDRCASAWGSTRK